MLFGLVLMVGPCLGRNVEVEMVVPKQLTSILQQEKYVAVFWRKWIISGVRLPKKNGASKEKGKTAVEFTAVNTVNSVNTAKCETDADAILGMGYCHRRPLNQLASSWSKEFPNYVPTCQLVINLI